MESKCKSCYKELTCSDNKPGVLMKACSNYRCGINEISGSINGDIIKTGVIKPIELTKTMRHMQVCKELNSLYEAKNHDYGDSFAKVRNELGNVAILVRLYDKVERLKTLLMGADAKVKDESAEDSLKDMANYALMELVERAVDKECKK